MSVPETTTATVDTEAKAPAKRRRVRPRYFGRLYQRKGRWSVRVRLDGEEVNRTFGKDRALAEAFLAGVQNATVREDALGVREVARCSWGDFWTTLDAWLRANHAPSTYASEKAKAAVFGGWLGTKALVDVTRADVESFLAHVRNERKGKAAAFNRYRSLVSTVFQRAVLAGFARSNPTEGIRWAREQEKPVPFLDGAAIDKVLSHADADVRPLLVVAADSGLRRSELLALAPTDVDLDARTLTVAASKNRNARTIRLTQRALDALRVAIKVRGPVPLTGPDLIFARFARDPSGVSKRFAKAAKAAGFSTLTLHGLRHAYASALAHEGVAPGVIGTLLGDSTPRVVFRYLRHAPKRAEDEAMDRLAKARGQKVAKPRKAPVASVGGAYEAQAKARTA